MKGRSAESIVADMKAIGLDDATFHAISGAAGLQDAAASTFCHQSSQVVNLSDSKQIELLHKTVPHYVHMVNTAVTADLTKNQFDALVSYACNPGGGTTATAAITE